MTSSDTTRPEDAFDFSGYKRSALQRRMSKRVHALGLASFGAYVDHLQVYPEEFGQLFNTILINVTSFFRDGSAWDSITQQVVPQLLRAKAPAAPIRIWCAGCATGQEAYTLAMVLADALGNEAFSRRVKIYATDIDDDALTRARHAVYSARDVETVPQRYLDTYFERSGDGYAFLRELRRSVIFGRHNLLSDAPISKVDLLSCRNTLMYFNGEAQARILSSLHFALAESGMLFLGKADMLLMNSPLFSPADLKHRLFNKLSHAPLRARVPLSLASRRPVSEGASGSELLREVAFDAAPIALLGFDRQLALRVANEHARRLLGIAPSEYGRQAQELALSRKLTELQPGLEKVVQERRPLSLLSAEWKRVGSESLVFDIGIVPLLDSDSEALGVQVSVADVTALRRMQSELQRTTVELAGTYQELQSAGEELETTNEELQSTVEELETSNEELQSTNEELETTNEELQSTNEELQSMNEELRVRTGALAQVNLYFEAILSSLRAAVVVLDMELRVQVWSERAHELWGLRQEETTGKHLLTLDIGLPVEELTAALRACLTGAHAYREVTVAATNRRGRAITCHVTVSPLRQDGNARGVIMLMEARDTRESHEPPS
jgi:two-component system, chemotaxis family, CheB/CheR fusion protein